jgi:hypothetical protein
MAHPQNGRFRPSKMGTISDACSSASAYLYGIWLPRKCMAGSATSVPLLPRRFKRAMSPTGATALRMSSEYLWIHTRTVNS